MSESVMEQEFELFRKGLRKANHQQFEDFDPRRQEPVGDFLRAWAEEAAGASLERAREMIWAALSVTFFDFGRWRGAAAAALLEAFDRAPKERRLELLAALGGAHKDEDSGFLPLSSSAGDQERSELALAVSRASLETLMAIGEGAVAGRPALAAAQLCAASSANEDLPMENREACLAQLAALCDKDSEAAAFALLALAGKREDKDPDLEDLDPLAYARAFSGKPLPPGVLFHLLERRLEGQRMLDWCEEAGFSGARWPASPAACLMGIKSWAPREGLAECLRDRVASSREAAEKLKTLEGPWASESERLAERLAIFPINLRDLRQRNDVFFNAVFSSAKAKRAAWKGWIERLNELEQMGNRYGFAQREAQRCCAVMGVEFGFEHCEMTEQARARALAQAELIERRKLIKGTAPEALEASMASMACLEASLLEAAPGKPAAKKKTL